MKAWITMTMATMGKKTPMLMLMIMILSSTLMAGVVGVSSSNAWNCLLLIMVYVSGIMVLFMYITSLSPQEKTKIKKNKILLVLIFIATTGLGVYSSDNMVSWSNSIKNSFQMNEGGVWMLLGMLSMMATTLPMVSMNLNKGLKSSK